MALLPNKPRDDYFQDAELAALRDAKLTEEYLKLHDKAKRLEEENKTLKDRLATLRGQLGV